MTGVQTCALPIWADAYLRLGDAYLLTGGYIAAIDFYDKAIGVHASDGDYATYKKAQCLGLAGKNLKKAEELERLISNYPQSDYVERARYEIGTTQLQLENYQQAIAGLNSFKEKHPQSPLRAKADVQIGLAYSNTDRNQKALERYKKVVAEYPGSNEAMEAIGLARLIYARENRIEDYLDWVDDLEFVNFSRSTLDSTAFSSAFDQYSSGDCTSAITALKSYLQRFEKGIFSLRARYYLADCARKSGQNKLAAEAYRGILEFKLNDYTAEAHAFLAERALAQGELVEARDLYSAYLSIASNRKEELESRLGLMEAQFGLGSFSKALDNARILLGVEGLLPAQEIKVRRVAALCLIEKEQWEPALEQLALILEKSAGDEKAEAYFHKAEVLYAQEKYEQSNEVVFKLIEELPGYKEWKMKALILSAKNYWQQEDIFQANYTLDFVIQSAYNQETMDEAQALKERIALYEKEQETERLKERQQQTDSVKLEGDAGMIIIDQKEEPQDTTLKE